MWKKRLVALGILIITVALGFLMYHTETTGKKPFRLGLDLSGGSYLVYRADVSALPGGQIGESMDALRDVIERRVNLFGVAEPQVTTEINTIGGDREHRLIVELPGVTDLKEAITMIGQTPLLEFKIEDPNFDPAKPKTISISADDIKDGVLDIGSIATPDYYVATDLTGRYLERATLQFDPTTQQPSIGLKFTKEGADLFEKITAENIGKTVAIYLDGSPLSTPMVNEKISGGEAVITGTFTPQEAKQLVGRLNSGALPVPIELISTDTIGPTLGAGALHAGVYAGLIGLILIAVLLVIWYRVPGIVAALALVVYSMVMLAIFKYLPVTLTSAGLAGFIISLGMAVDANILIFERMKEELQSGKTLAESIRIGFDRAWSSIRDGNISSIISAVILFWFGTSLIQGFALTFGIGVLVSMLSAITVSRAFLAAISGDKNSRLMRVLFTSGFNRGSLGSNK